MKRRSRVLIALCSVLSLLTVPAEPQSLSDGCPSPVFPITIDEAITVSSTSIGFTAATIANNGNPAVRADCSIATENIRYRVTGLAPSATVGVLILSTSGQFSVCGEQVVKQIRFIRQTADAALYCSYYSRNP